MSNIIAFERPVNGVKVEQRFNDGFINATAMARAHGKDISDWLKTDDAWEMVEALANDLGIKPKDHKSGNSVYTRIAAAYPELVQVKRGSSANGGGSWVHPDLAVYIAQWCFKPFAIRVSRWIQEWLTTGQNPVQFDPDEEFRLWKQRYDVRIRLKDIQRPELMDVVADWAKRHSISPIKLCSQVHDEINIGIQGKEAIPLKVLGGLPLGVLLRDHLDTLLLSQYGTICQLTKNAIVDDGSEPLQAVKDSCRRHLGASYVPKVAKIHENLYVEGKRLKEAKRQKRLENQRKKLQAQERREQQRLEAGIQFEIKFDSLDEAS